MDSPVLDAAVHRALEPPTPGTLVRFTGRIFSGAKRTEAQIGEFADFWRDETLRTIETGGAVLAVLGDSLAQGIGATSPDHGYVAGVRAHLEDQLGAPIGVANFSRSGARTRDVLAIQLPALAAANLDPIAVVCTVGSNDLLRSARLRKLGHEVAELVEALPPRSVVATAPAKGSSMAKLLNRRIRSVAADHACPVADIGRLLTSWRGSLAGDGFHPNDTGYRIWTDAFIDALTDSPPAPGTVCP